MRKCLRGMETRSLSVGLGQGQRQEPCRLKQACRRWSMLKGLDSSQLTKGWFSALTLLWSFLPRAQSFPLRL